MSIKKAKILSMLSTEPCSLKKKKSNGRWAGGGFGFVVVITTTWKQTHNGFRHHDDELTFWNVHFCAVQDVQHNKIISANGTHTLGLGRRTPNVKRPFGPCLCLVLVATASQISQNHPEYSIKAILQSFTRCLQSTQTSTDPIKE